MSTPHPKTIASIEMQAPHETHGAWTFYVCACSRRGTNTWRLCEYHLGYDDAMQEAGRE